MAMAEERAASQAGGDLIFALDIGTRSIIGIVGEQRDDVLSVLAVERMDHPKRAMLDGQIEDIEQTAKVAGAVKERLEKRLGLRLNHVCVAAAGRALRTQSAGAAIELDPGEALDAARVSELELQAVQQAYEELFSGQGENSEFYCVGYSVVRYLLDDYPISTLIGHRGRHARAEIIATFLPNEVVESLYATMSRIGLTVASLTLEPIAAMNAIIPKELRLLNLALVDIGAGTSDIAISKGGGIAAYTMATVAGDEISEAIIREYLVDFETAERIKLGLGGKLSHIDYTDILGYSYSVTPEEVLEKIAPEAENLGATICGKILEVNGQAPAAVFLVGGGSQLPFLCERIAEKLGIDRTKVAVGSNNYMKKAVESGEELSGPEYATPVGIALSAAIARERGDFSVTVNGVRTRLFKSGGVSVMDVLAFCGYRHGQLIGRSGQSVAFLFNGQPRTVRGGLPRPATVHLNGKPAILSTPVHPEDVIELEPAEGGADAHPTLRELAGEWNPITVQLCGVEIPAGTICSLNGESAGPDAPVCNQDEVQLRQVRTLWELCEQQELDMPSCRFWINGEPCEDPQRVLEDGDEILYAVVPARPCAPPERELPAGNPESAPRAHPPAQRGDAPDGRAVAPDSPAPEARISPEGRTARATGAWSEAPPGPQRLASHLRQVPQAPAAESPPPAGGWPAATEERTLSVRINGEQRVLPARTDGTPYQFVDMLNYVDIDPSKPQGNIVLRLNGRSASYLEPIREGDMIDIFWDRR